MKLTMKLKEVFKNPFFQNSFFLLLDKVGKLGNFIAILLIARYYGTSIFGEFSYAFAFVSILGSFSDLGIKNILIKFLVRDENNQNVFLGTSFILITIFSFLCVVMGIFYTFLTNDSYLIKKFIILLSFSYLFKPFAVIFYFFESKVNVKRVVSILIFNVVICLALKVFFIINQYDVVLFGYITVFEALIEAMILIYLFFKSKYSILDWSFKLDISKMILKESLPLFVSGVMIMIYMRVDQLLIKNLIDDSEVLGKYAISVKIIEGVYILPGIIIPTLLPVLLFKLKLNTNEMMKFLQSGYQLLAAVSYSIFLFLFIGSSFLISKFILTDPELSSNVLRILSPTIFLVAFGGLQNAYFNIINRNEMVLFLTIFGAISNITLNFILIKEYGVIGSAVATVFSHLLLIILPYFIEKTGKNLPFMIFALIRPSFKLLK